MYHDKGESQMDNDDILDKIIWMNNNKETIILTIMCIFGAAFCFYQFVSGTPEPDWWLEFEKSFNKLFG